MQYSNIKKIHFVGIKGVGMTPLAVIAKQAGFDVSGCDLADVFITDHTLHTAGIIPLTNFNESHAKDIDLLITTGAHGGFDNKEVKRAIANKIPVLTQGEAVGIFMKGEIFGRGLKGISIAGCHGKTTTTAMIATLFKKAEFHPSFIIGTGDIPSLGGSGEYGKGDYFIAEADEYATEPKYNKKPKFLWQYPQILVITNIEFDHPDIYQTIDDVLIAYQELASHVEKEGILVANGDDPYTKKLIENYKGKKFLFGFSPNNDYILRKVSIQEGKTTFTLEHDRLENIYVTNAIGKHNALNAVAAIVVASICNISPEDIKKGLLSFDGTKRRMELKGFTKYGAVLYDDYAHHPTEIAKTLEALRSLYPDKKIVSIFQPHTYSRTKLLFDQFISSFEAADEIIVTDIFASAREASDLTISSEKLVEGIRQYTTHVKYLPTLQDVVKYVKEKQYGKDTVVVSMGAGDIYKISEGILEAK